MRIEQSRPLTYQVSLHAYELAALIAAARWVVEGGQGELPPGAVDQLRQVVDSYDRATRRLTESQDSAS
ncbi:MAG: hypothetical protein R3272_12345 [Candidatus Promineifilaceae bacterium]|nr:hypothetical protein [Candidatus Promineifilaceae bacterium]